MRKFLLALLCSIPLLGQADDFIIDETKSDIYFANGVLTDDGNATENLNLIREKVRLEQYNGSRIQTEKELNFKKAYNQTFGFAGDFYEAYKQLADESMGWGALKVFIDTALMFTPGKIATILGQAVNIWDDMSNRAHDADLSLQIAKYREYQKRTQCDRYRTFTGKSVYQ